MSRSLLFACLACILVAQAASVEAQGVAGSFQELRLLVRQGDTVTVRLAGGAEVSGKIDSLTSTALVLRGAERREFLEPDVANILQRRGDSLGNGALIGMAVGAGLMGIVAAASCDGCSDADAGFVAAAILVYGGIGAAIGVGIDALITKQYVVYEKPVKSFSWRVSPMVGRGRQGVAVSFSFR